MKRLMVAALLGGQLMAAAQPVAAAGLVEADRPHLGTFAGLRLRMPLDGPAHQRSVRAGLALAPTVHRSAIDGALRMRMGESFELGLVGNEPLRLSIGGTPVSRLRQGPVGPDGRRHGISTVAWVGIGVAVVAAGVVTLFILCRDGEVCGSE